MHSLIDTLTLEECTANVYSVNDTGFVCNINFVKNIRYITQTNLDKLNESDDEWFSFLTTKLKHLGINEY